MDDSLGANIWIDHNNGKIWRIMPRCNPEVNRSWLSNTSRLAYMGFTENRLASGDLNIVSDLLKHAKKVALVAGGACTLEDLAALKMLKDYLGDRASLFGGTLRPVVEADGIAKSGDPLANRAGFKALGIPDNNLNDLMKHAADYDVLLTVHNDLFGDDEGAMILKKIPNRVILSAFNDETSKDATLVCGVNHWSEVTGSMINSLNILQKLSPAPTCPDAQLKPAYEVLSTLAGNPLTSAIAALQKVQEFVPALKPYSYENIRSTGVKLDGVLL